MRSTVSRLMGAVALVLMISFVPAMAQNVVFEPLGETCGPAFFPRFCVKDMSGDGQVLLFGDKLTTPSGDVPISGPPTGWETIALSDDGSTVVGNVVVTDAPLGPRTEAAIWMGDDEWMPLGGLEGATPCGTTLTSVYDVSGDGKTVAGLAFVGCKDAFAFTWTEETGMVNMGSIVEGRASRINAIAADGSTFAGWSDTSFGSRLAALWVDGGGPEWIEPDGSSKFVGEATGISSDGTWVVGGNYGEGTTIFEPWLYSEETGVMPLGSVKGLRGQVIDGQHFSRDVSDDGRVVVGQDVLFNLGEIYAFVWLADSGIHMLQNYVRDNTDAGTAAMICDGERPPILPRCTDWSLWNTAAVSNDGKIIVGTGANPDGILEAYRVILP